MKNDWDSEGMERVVAMDFDGVIHRDPVWKGIGIVEGAPVRGVPEAIKSLVRSGYKICVFTCRAREREGFKAVVHWLTANGLIEYIDSVTAQKPVAKCYIDDRCIPFTGNAESLVSNVQTFESWTEKRELI